MSTKLRDALDARAKLLKGGDLPPFIGGGMYKMKGKGLKSFWNSFKKYGFEALQNALQGGAKGFAGTSGDLGAKALGALKGAVSEAGPKLYEGFAESAPKLLEAESGRGLNAMNQMAKDMKSKAKISRPKI